MNCDVCWLFELFIYFMDEALLSRVIRCKTLSAQCSLGSSGAEPQLRYIIMYLTSCNPCCVRHIYLQRNSFPEQ